MCIAVEHPLLPEQPHSVDTPDVKPLSGLRRKVGVHPRKNTTPQLNETVGLAWDDLSLGQKLGHGSFCAVFDVRLDAKLLERSETSCETEEASNMEFAVKCAKDNAVAQDVFATEEGLRNEAMILRSLPEHMHIVKLQAVSRNLLKPTSRVVNEESFLLLERLESSLDRYLQRCRNRQVIDEGFIASIAPRRMKSFLRKATTDPARRMECIGLPIARALEFLHRHNVIYRDLKPANVGFDCDNEVRLFDFGLSRKIPGNLPPNFHLTAYVGTPRYMAPEIREGHLYRKEVDVYSFGLVLGELFTLEQPPPPPTKHKSYHEIVCPQTRALVRACVRHDSSKRPSMEQVVQAMVETTKKSMSASKQMDLGWP